jgi:GNAT superfamily N-acetyltransferase
MQNKTEPIALDGRAGRAVRLRPAVPEDVPLVLCLIRELAEYEKLAQATEAALREHLFGARPYCEALIAELDGAAVGFALFFHNYSTFAGKPGLYLEDLFVRPAARGVGVGKALLVRLAQTALERGCARFEWSVLDWNTPAIEFYRSLGARPMDDWTIFRVSGEALSQLAQGPPAG